MQTLLALPVLGRSGQACRPFHPSSREAPGPSWPWMPFGELPLLQAIPTPSVRPSRQLETDPEAGGAVAWHDFPFDEAAKEDLQAAAVQVHLEVEVEAHLVGEVQEALLHFPRQSPSMRSVFSCHPSLLFCRGTEIFRDRPRRPMQREISPSCSAAASSLPPRLSPLQLLLLLFVPPRVTATVPSLQRSPPHHCFLLCRFLLAIAVSATPAGALAPTPLYFFCQSSPGTPRITFSIQHADNTWSCLTIESLSEAQE
mmetsp:Transcript_15418/g.33382  ORF Transcript_15418/g.33382 Transcript_15418/m.33382 type:complete len:256 (-) Transcript_15418:44-811(-)